MIAEEAESEEDEIEFSLTSTSSKAGRAGGADSQLQALTQSFSERLITRLSQHSHIACNAVMATFIPDLTPASSTSHQSQLHSSATPTAAIPTSINPQLTLHTPQASTSSLPPPASSATASESHKRPRPSQVGGRASDFMQIPLPHYEVIQGEGTRDSPHKIRFKTGVTDGSVNEWPETNVANGNGDVLTEASVTHPDKLRMWLGKSGKALAEQLALRKSRIPRSGHPPRSPPHRRTRRR